MESLEKLEALSLLETLRDWRRQEEKTTQRPKESLLTRESLVAKPPISSLPPPAPAPVPAAEQAPHPSPRAIELRLTASKPFLLTVAAILGLAGIVALLVFFFADAAHKTRGPVDSRLPDPSSPTVQPSTESDPIPSLKAPTRPRRD